MDEWAIPDLTAEESDAFMAALDDPMNSRIPGHCPECVGCERDAWRKWVNEQRRPSPARALLRRWFGYRPDRIEVYRGPEPAAEPYDD